MRVVSCLMRHHYHFMYWLLNMAEWGGNQLLVAHYQLWLLCLQRHPFMRCNRYWLRLSFKDFMCSLYQFRRNFLQYLLLFAGLRWPKVQIDITLAIVSHMVMWQLLEMIPSIILNVHSLLIVHNAPLCDALNYLMILIDFNKGLILISILFCKLIYRIKFFYEIFLTFQGIFGWFYLVDHNWIAQTFILLFLIGFLFLKLSFIFPLLFSLLLCSRLLVIRENVVYFVICGIKKLHHVRFWLD